MRYIIDIHSHLVYDVDDGAKDIGETLYMIKEAYNAGFTDIILTPHYMEDFYIKETLEISKKISIIKEELRDIKVNLYEGNEIYANSNLIELIKERKATSLAKSKYILFELPMQELPINLDEIVYNILENGGVPVIAHPERYLYVHNDPNILIDYIDKGVLFQANYGSLIGIYGTKTKEIVKSLLLNNMIHFLGSDNHRPNSIYREMPKIIDMLNKIIGKERVEELTTINPVRILKDESIDIKNPIPLRKTMWGNWK